jgi:RNA polymerase sigma factor (sigma-70 family)
VRALREPTPHSDLLISRQPLIDKVVRSIARRKRLPDDEAEELHSIVRLKLLEHGHEIVGKFEGKSRFETYLTTVVHRIFLDYRNEKWGKWRPSMVARRLGWVAEHLERLLFRDRIGFEEAAEILIRNHRVRLTVGQLAELAGRLPARGGQREEDAEILAELPHPCDSHERVRIAEAQALARRAEEVVGTVLRELPPEDSLILRMRFVGGHTIAEIARALQLDQKPLYPRVERLRERLRQQLEAHGVTAAQAVELMSEPEVELRFDFGDEAEPGRSRPSPKERGT